MCPISNSASGESGNNESLGVAGVVGGVAVGESHTTVIGLDLGDPPSLLTCATGDEFNDPHVRFPASHGPSFLIHWIF